MKKQKTYCERCKKALDPEKIKWLELSATDGKYYEDIPAGHRSQGFFSFGVACATTQLKNTKNVPANKD